MKFIHLTDLHIMPGTDDPVLIRAEERTRQAIAQINADHGDAALCVVTGDIVADPDRAAYAHAEQLLAGLSMPVYSLLGNHDDRDMARTLLSTVTADENGFLQQAVDTPAGRFVMLDTKADVGHGGTLCEKRLTWIEAQLKAVAGPVWLFMHHAPFATGIAAMDEIGLDAPSSRALADLVQAHGNINHLFFGHYHRPMSGAWRGIPFSAHRSMMVQCALILPPQDDVTAIHEEPQYAIVLTDEDRTVVHYHDFVSDAATESMGPANG